LPDICYPFVSVDGSRRKKIAKKIDGLLAEI